MQTVHVYGDIDNLITGGPDGNDAGTRLTFRFDALLKLVRRVCGDVTTAELYGSNNTRYHEAWGNALSAGFLSYAYVYTTPKQGQIADTTMAVNITRTVMGAVSAYPQYAQYSPSATIVVIAVGSNLLPAVSAALQNNIRVVLFGYRHAISRAFRHEEALNRLFSIVELDAHVDTLYTKTAIDPVVENEIALDMQACALNREEIITVLHCLKTAFAVRDITLKGKGRYLLLEVNGQPTDKILQEVHRLIPSGNAQMYADVMRDTWASKVRQPAQSPPPPENPAIPAPKPVPAPPQESTPAQEEAAASPSDDNEDDSYDDTHSAAPGSYKEPCKFGLHCANGAQCPWLHTAEQLKLFRARPNVNFQFWKSKRCQQMKRSTHAMKTCNFSHGRENGDMEWCTICRWTGHLTEDH